MDTNCNIVVNDKALLCAVFIWRKRNMYRKSYLVTLGLFFMSSCGQEEQKKSHVSEFENLTVKSKANQAVDLTNLKQALQKNPGVKKINYASVVENLESNKAFIADEMKSNIKVWFGKLDKEQCELVKRTYADSWESGLSGVDCAKDANKRNFYLQDFLSPAMQANLRVAFHAETDSQFRDLTESEKIEYDIRIGVAIELKTLDTNCWSTTFEVLRRSETQYTVHNYSPVKVESFFKNNLQSRTNSTMKSSALKSWVNQWGTSFGQVLLVRDTIIDPGTNVPTYEMVHSAVFVDKNLVFERFMNGAPARLVTLEQLLATYPNADFEVYKAPNKFPHVKTTGFNVGEPLTEIQLGEVYKTTLLTRDYKLQKDSQGRYILK